MIKPSKQTARKPCTARPAETGEPGTPTDFWDLRLYVVGQAPRSAAAIANLKKFCEEFLKGMYRIEVIDLLEQPQLARGDQIVAVPTLVRKLPTPIRKIVGDLSRTDSVLVGLDLRPRHPDPGGR